MQGRRFQPSLFGGLFIGIVSALPIVGGANLCCCLWVVVGGLLTVYLQRQAAPERLDTAEAVLGGLLAGLMGAAIFILINGLLLAATGDRFAAQLQNALNQNPQVPPEIRDRFEQLLSGPRGRMFSAVLLGAVTVPMYAIFGMLGALLGVAVFRKSTKPPDQPAA
jgi:hypothetical protein